MNFKRLIAIGTAIAAVLAVLAMPVRAGKNLVETAVGAGEFKTLVSLVKRAGLVDALSGDSKLTVLAPTDKAFSKLPKATLEAVLNDNELLKQVLLYHVVSGEVPASTVVGLRTFATLNGKSINVRIKHVNGKAVVGLNSAKVLKTDIRANNGIIHVIDTVLIPPAN